MIFGNKKIKDRNIFIISISELFNVDNLSKSSPKIVLFSARENEQYEDEVIKSAIYNLINIGCKYFVYYGICSEWLHDKIDDFIYMYDYDNNSDNSINILTTYHVNEPVNEIIDFLLYYMVDSNKFNTAIVLNQKYIDDIHIIEYINNSFE